MTIKSTTAKLFALLAGTVLFAAGAQAALLNAGFESPDASGGDVAGAGAPWESFNFNFTASNLFRPGGSFLSPAARSGTQVLKQFGVDGGSFQDVEASAGQLWEASVWAISYSGDQFNNLALLQLSFRDAGGNVLGDPVETFCDTLGNQACLLTPQDGDPATDWTQIAVSGLAPAGTASARILLLHILTDGTPAGGAIFWDDAQLQVVPAPPAVWLLGTAILGLVARRRLRRAQAA